MSLLKWVIFGSSGDNSPLSLTQLLLILSEKTGMSLEDLATRTGFCLSTTAKMIGHLESAHKKLGGTAPYIRVVSLPNREKLIYITASGEEYLKNLNEEDLISTH